MGWRFQKRVKIGSKTFLNFNKNGFSLSQKIGQVVKINSRGYLTFSIPKTGLSYKIRLYKCKRER